MWLCAAVAGIALAVAPAHAEPVQAPATATTTESGKFSFSQYLPADRIAEHAAAAADAVTDLVDSGLSLL
ncbi:MAG: hypothetical protein GY848_05665, partial [Methyloversatilis sp.]|nr:hypothetical protein [Methyloversatilis sp.]